MSLATLPYAPDAATRAQQGKVVSRVVDRLVKVARFSVRWSPRSGERSGHVEVVGSFSTISFSSSVDADFSSEAEFKRSTLYTEMCSFIGQALLLAVERGPFGNTVWIREGSDMDLSQRAC